MAVDDGIDPQVRATRRRNGAESASPRPRPRRPDRRRRWPMPRPVRRCRCSSSTYVRRAATRAENSKPRRADDDDDCVVLRARRPRPQSSGMCGSSPTLHKQLYPSPTRRTHLPLATLTAGKPRSLACPCELVPAPVVAFLPLPRLTCPSSVRVRLHSSRVLAAG